MRVRARWMRNMLAITMATAFVIGTLWMDAAAAGPSSSATSSSLLCPPCPEPPEDPQPPPPQKPAWACGGLQAAIEPLIGSLIRHSKASGNLRDALDLLDSHRKEFGGGGVLHASRLAGRVRGDLRDLRESQREAALVLGGLLQRCEGGNQPTQDECNVISGLHINTLEWQDTLINAFNEIGEVREVLAGDAVIYSRDARDAWRNMREARRDIAQSTVLLETGVRTALQQAIDACNASASA